MNAPAEVEQQSQPSVSMLVRALAAAQDEYERAREEVARAQKSSLVAAGNVGEMHRQLGALVKPGESITVRIGELHVITVTMPAEGMRGAPTCVRSRIVR